jgi:hypothetical protein
MHLEQQHEPLLHTNTSVTLELQRLPSQSNQQNRALGTNKRMICSKRPALTEAKCTVRVVVVFNVSLAWK